MIVHVPFSYQIMARYGSSRRIETADLRGVEPIELREAVAPVALTWRASAILHRATDPEAAVVIRMGEHGLLAPCGQAGRAPHEGRRPSAAWADAVSEGRRAEGNPFAPPASAAVDEAEALATARVTADGRPDALAALRGRASQIVLVDGIPHEPCAEPYLVVGPDHEAGTRDWVTARLPPPEGRPDPTRCHRMDDWDGVLRRERAACARYRRDPVLPATNPFADVALRQALSMPFEAWEVGARARDLFSALAAAISETGSSVARSKPTGADAWDPPLGIALPPEGLVEAWGELGAMLRDGLSDASVPSLHAISSGVLAKLGALPEARRLPTVLETVRVSAMAMGNAADRHSQMPAWLRTDHEALSALAP